MTIEENKKWYIVQVVAGYEQKVKEELENKDFNLSTIKEILLPLKVHTTKTGKLKTKPMFPGYLYVKVEMSDESWFIIRNTNHVTGIVGSSGQRTKPTPIREEEITKIREKAIEEELRIKNISETSNEKDIITNTNYKIGDSIRISKGEFASQEGKVIAISIERQKVSVELEFFGRMTSFEIDLDLVIKI